MAAWLWKITNKMFGGFGCKIEEPRKRDFSRGKNVDQPEDKGENADLPHIENESIQQRKTCHFFIVFPKTEKQDSNSQKEDQENSLDDKRPHVEPPNKLPCKNLQRNVSEIPTRKKQFQQMQKDGFLQSDSTMTQATEEYETTKGDIVVSKAMYNMSLIQSSETQKVKESDSIEPKVHHDDNSLPNGEYFDDEDVGSMMEFLNHDEKCIFAEKLKCDSSGTLSQGGESFQVETTPSPIKPFPIYTMLNENQPGNEHYCETRFFNGTNTIHKRKRNLEFDNEVVVPKIKREVEKEILDHSVDHKDSSSFFLKSQNIASPMSKAEESTDLNFYHSKLVGQKPMIKC